ncbi:HNH endonuclease [Paraburkholderia sp. BL8N3]|nr:HNH endonuclease [Paraburkholderia sp. BL8N3]TCK37987.1 HNH endonuclease [Paraburkholderia sp. BL8N3]
MPGRWAALYNTSQWRKLRAAQLHAHPVCLMCLAQGFDVKATVVDHIRPHKGDTRRFYDPANLQSLCKTCHDSTKHLIELYGMTPGCDADGNPTDPNHPWNLKRKGAKA